MPEAVRTRLVLVRHGESRAVVDRVVAGPLGCKGLSDLGRRQVEALVARLVRTGELDRVTALLSSDLARAVETAELLAPALGNLSVLTDPDLREIEPGEGDGLSWEEWEERYGGFHPPDDPFRAVAPGGESLAAFNFRVGATLDRLAVAHAGGTVVIACHGGIVGGSMLTFLGMSPVMGSAGGLGFVANTSMTEWLVGSDGARRRWELVRYNDSAHLRPDGEPWPVLG